MVWVPNGLNKLPKVHFKFCFIFVGKLTMAFLTGQSQRLLKSWYSAWGPEQGFWCCFTEGLNKSLVVSVTQADGPTVSISKSVKSPIDYSKIFLCEKPSGNIQLSATEISKVLESCQLVHLYLNILQFLNCKPPIGLHGKYVFTQCVSKAHLSGWVNSTTTLLCTMLLLASLTHAFHKCFSQSFASKSKQITQ